MADLRLFEPLKRSSIQRKYVRCSKKDCGKCPHGPYLYRVWREGGKVRTEYIGKFAAPNLPQAGEKVSVSADGRALTVQHPYSPGAKVRFHPEYVPYWITLLKSYQRVHADTPLMVVEQIGWAKFGRSRTLCPYVFLLTAETKEPVYHPYDATMTVADPAGRLDRRFPTQLVLPA